MIYTATTSAELLEYVKTAVKGDVIELAPGTYDGLHINDVTKSGTVTIRSQYSNDPAVLTDLVIKRSSGLTFSDLEIFVEPGKSLQIYNSSHIKLDSLDVHGTLNGSSNDDALGILIRKSNNVTVSNSKFHELTDGVAHLDTTGTTIIGNTFEIIRDNGVLGGGSSRILVANNYFTNFDHVGDIHPDAIQFWTTNTDKSASDITVTGNVFERGEGSIIQGIWIKDDVERLPYKNVTVTDNVIVGAAYHGITVSGALFADIKNNVVIAADDQPSWIGVFKVSYARMEDNIATSFSSANSAVNGNGNVLATSLALNADGSFPDGVTGLDLSNLQGAEISDDASASVLSDVSLLGFFDNPSRFGLTYNFVTTDLVGTVDDDRLRADTNGTFRLYGYEGDDVLSGNKSGTGNLLDGGAGDDHYDIYQAIDTVVELQDGGTDTVYAAINYTLGDNVENLRGTAAGLTLTGNELANGMAAALGGNVLSGLGGDDLLQGNSGNDRLLGGADNDRLLGNAGNDYLDGGTGNDQLSGGLGKDNLLGGTGNDSLEGGAGADVMAGGLGADVFFYRETDFGTVLAADRDTITDFSAASGDKISLSMIDANANTTANDNFSFIGTQAFRGVAGQLRFVAESGGITLYGDTNGDKVADLAIHLAGVSTITASSFML